MNMVIDTRFHIRILESAEGWSWTVYDDKTERNEFEGKFPCALLAWKGAIDWCVSQVLEFGS